jgi:glutathione S-transferase
MKLFRFRYSPYARKVQMLLDLAGFPHEVIEVPYTQREEMVALTGGWVQVPVLVDDDGRVIVESRDICEHLLRKQPAVAARLVPSPLEGPIWAFADFVDGPLEDVMFRLASPFVRDAWPTAWERGLSVFSKERQFGAGCVEAWERDRDVLLARARRFLAGSVATLARQPFLFGETPTLADAALHGVLAMIEEARPQLVLQLDPSWPAYMRRVERAAPAKQRG